MPVLEGSNMRYVPGVRHGTMRTWERLFAQRGGRGRRDSQGKRCPLLPTKMPRHFARGRRSILFRELHELAISCRWNRRDGRRQIRAKKSKSVRATATAG